MPAAALSYFKAAYLYGRRAAQVRGQFCRRLLLLSIVPLRHAQQRRDCAELWRSMPRRWQRCLCRLGRPEAAGVRPGCGCNLRQGHAMHVQGRRCGIDVGNEGMGLMAVRAGHMGLGDIISCHRHGASQLSLAGLWGGAVRGREGLRGAPSGGIGPAGMGLYLGAWAGGAAQVLLCWGRPAGHGLEALQACDVPPGVDPVGQLVGRAAPLGPLLHRGPWDGDCRQGCLDARDVPLGGHPVWLGFLGGCCEVPGGPGKLPGLACSAAVGLQLGAAEGLGQLGPLLRPEPRLAPDLGG